MSGVSWDDDIPNIMESQKAMFQTTNQYHGLIYMTHSTYQRSPDNSGVPSLVNLKTSVIGTCRFVQVSMVLVRSLGLTGFHWENGMGSILIPSGHTSPNMEIYGMMEMVSLLISQFKKWSHGYEYHLNIPA